MQKIYNKTADFLENLNGCFLKFSSVIVQIISSTKQESVKLGVKTELHKNEPFLFDTAPRSTLREAFLRATLNDVPKISGSLKMYNKLCETFVYYDFIVKKQSHDACTCRLP